VDTWAFEEQGGPRQLPKVVYGVKFRDGIEASDQAEPANATAAASSSHHPNSVIAPQQFLKRFPIKIQRSVVLACDEHLFI
jgi:hypothetical protein